MLLYLRSIKLKGISLQIICRLLCIGLECRLNWNQFGLESYDYAYYDYC